MFKMTYISSLFWFLRKSEVGVDKNFIHRKGISTFLGIIPLGQRETQIIMPNISKIEQSFSFNFETLLLAFIIGGVGNIFPDIINAVIQVISIYIFVESFGTKLEIIENSGDINVVRFICTERRKAKYLKAEIYKHLSNKQDDINVRIQNEVSDLKADKRHEELLNALKNK